MINSYNRNYMTDLTLTLDGLISHIDSIKIRYDQLLLCIDSYNEITQVCFRTAHCLNHICLLSSSIDDCICAHWFMKDPAVGMISVPMKLYVTDYHISLDGAFGKAITTYKRRRKIKNFLNN